MKLLNCTLRLGGVLTHSVPKLKITELELMLLKHIHGDDAIADLKQVGDVNVDKNAEYRSLARYYSVANVEKCFDVKLDNFSDWLEDQLESEDAKRFEASIYGAQEPTRPVANIPQENGAPEDFDFDGEGNPIVKQPVETVLPVEPAIETLPAAVELAAPVIEVLTPVVETKSKTKPAVNLE